MMRYEKLLQGARSRRSRRELPYYRSCWQDRFRRRRAVPHGRGAERLSRGYRHRKADGVPIPETRIGPSQAASADRTNLAPLLTVFGSLLANERFPFRLIGGFRTSVQPHGIASTVE